MKRAKTMASFILFLFFINACSQYSDQLARSNGEVERVGVLFVSHGGNEVFNEKGIWDVTVQIFSYDENSPLYTSILWTKLISDF